MSDAPERTPLPDDVQAAIVEMDPTDAATVIEHIAALEQDRREWCDLYQKAEAERQHLRAAIEKWANAVGERERFDAESELIALTKPEGEK